ncbi:MAG: tRNA guanosine(15) transglycosylase TgtA [Candidatus Nitrosopumilus limneticus]|nr:tRNA guanosine(15) transglycosylase TgtA [Candidatus Nitrosopumilus limneticus]MDC4217315.1 tRNA guanosine(15) transglycosylase TgtA [Candidatus Nitrosopumilus limneticus]MDC4219890.1 tRNA guanosine(15) transglycosylase TgtA [Candidatus Nitrosopumilus limneticus]MDC4221187.1 tRNA guanosine(15) transglycosylase TgtA [Candidatus Nitrosopumilus limneticus]MDC4222609.1 tRNA guanosine(15) transglycosylase TgtA [Candidatus Nitrosopumilus limneticus]
MFEIIKTDLAGRIGIMYTNHGKIQTPAFVPVIHPVKQTIPSKKIKEIGFDVVITNAYITKNNYGDEAIKKGIHNIIDFDKSIMTDSGGYQVLEYGDLEVLPSDMANFETGILTDFAIPLDKPTGYGLPIKKAEAYVKHTLAVCKETLDNSKDNGQIWIGPIQGGEHFELVAKSTKALIDMGFQMLALGSPVEFMESYEYRLLAQMIVSAKKQMPESVPLHLFGAGHPLTIPFAIALGCDSFDSASYMLYAKQLRYITDDGTRHLLDIEIFPCNCEICTKYTPNQLRQLEDTLKINELAIHNLYAIKLEVDKVKQAIYEGRLWEYVIKKARAHPKLFEMIEVMTENSEFLGLGTPKFKERAIFLYSKEDQYRPEVQSFHKIVRKFKSKKKKLLITKESNTKPGYLSQQYLSLKKKVREFETYQICQYNPHMGLIPIEISDIFPAAHHETSRIKYDPKEFTEFQKTWEDFFKKNKFSEIHYDKKDKFLGYFVKTLPKEIKKKSFG